MGQKLGEAGGQTRTGERDEVRSPSGGEEVSSAGGSLSSDNLDLFETVFSASLSFCLLEVKEEDCSSCDKEPEETCGTKGETGRLRRSTKQ